MPTGTDYLTMPLTYTNITTDAWTTNMQPLTTATTYNFDFLCKSDLDNIYKTLFKIIEEHTKIDISEDEFMSIMQEATNE